MESLRYRLRVRSLDDPIRIHALGDFHVGAAGCAEGRLRRAIQYVATDRGSLVLLMGDLGDYIGTSDKRWDAATIAPDMKITDLADWGQVLTDRILDICSPLVGSPRLIGVLEGNHEHTYSVRHHEAVTEHIAAGLRCPALGYTALIGIEAKAPAESRTIWILAGHGSGGGGLEQTKIGRTLKTAAACEGINLFVSGHSHTCQTAIVPPRLVPGPDDQLDDDRDVAETVVCGTYLRTYGPGFSGYGERGGYPPAHLGHPLIHVLPRTGEVWVRWMFKRWRPELASAA